MQKAGININHCQLCNKEISGHRRHIHHKDKNRANNDLSNLMLLCAECHKHADGFDIYTSISRETGIKRQTVWSRLHPEYNKGFKDYFKKYNQKYYKEHREKFRESGKKSNYKNKEAISIRRRIRRRIKAYFINFT